jgi:HEAT repeat protein
MNALHDEDADVRSTAIGALPNDPSVMPDLVERLADVDPGARLAALSAIGSLGIETEAVREIRPLLRDPDPFVRARAAGLLLADGTDPEAERTLIELARADDADLRAATFRSVRGAETPSAFDLARSGLEDRAAVARAEAAGALATIDRARALDPLVEALADDSPVVRQAVAEGLGAIGGSAVDPVVRSLDSPERRDGSLAALERLPLAGRGDDIRRFAALAVASALESHRLGSAIEPDGDERLQLLKDSLIARADRDAVIGLRAAALLGNDGAMSVALESMSVTDPAQRANALEVIESVGARDIVRPLVSMWETAAPRGNDPDWLQRLSTDPDEWIRACADLLAGPKKEDGSMTQTLDTLPLMQRVLFLRKVALFAELPPPDLKPIAVVAEEHAFSDGDTIAEQGDPGDAMHIIVSGDVSIVVTSDGRARTIAVRSSGDVIGEMAVITSRPRMAGLVATGPVRVLSIGRPQLESILRERPETSLGVIRVLCQRLAEPMDAGVPG